MVDMPQFPVPEFVGRALYGTFTIVMVVVLLNMLIAMITGSFQKIEVWEPSPRAGAGEAAPRAGARLPARPPPLPPCSVTGAKLSSPGLIFFICDPELSVMRFVPPDTSLVLFPPWGWEGAPAAEKQAGKRRLEDGLGGDEKMTQRKGG